MEQTDVLKFFDTWLHEFNPDAGRTFDGGSIRFAKTAYYAGYTKRIIDETKDVTNHPRENRSISHLFRRR